MRQLKRIGKFEARDANTRVEAEGSELLARLSSLRSLEADLSAVKRVIDLYVLSIFG